jgi:hypothetical protein
MHQLLQPVCRMATVTDTELFLLARTATRYDAVIDQGEMQAGQRPDSLSHGTIIAPLPADVDFAISHQDGTLHCVR